MASIDPDPGSSSKPSHPNHHPIPKMPDTFDRWFWTPDYRRGVTALFDKLNSGLKESQELIAFIRKRESAERAYAHELRQSNPIDPLGFGYDDGASFLSVYKQLRSSQVDLAQAHERLALQLDRLVISPFETWSQDHHDRVTTAISRVESILIRWEKQAQEVTRLQQIYHSKMAQADEADEDHRLSPARVRIDRHSLPSQPSSPADRSPQGSPKEPYSQLGRIVSQQAMGLSRAVTQTMRIRDGRLGFRAQSLQEPHEPRPANHSNHEIDPPDSVHQVEKLSSPESLVDQDNSRSTQHSSLEKGKSKSANSSPVKPRVSTTLLDITGIIKTPAQWSKLFQEARDAIFKQSVKVPLLGTYQGAHSGEDLVIFFKTNLLELGSDAARATAFCAELSEQLSILRLIGEIGNKFIPTQDAFYVWKPEAFTLHDLSSETGFKQTLTELPERRQFKSTFPSESPSRSHHSPRSLTPSTSGSGLDGVETANHNQPPGTGAVLSKYLQTAVNQAAKGINELSATVGVSAPPIAVDQFAGENRTERLRREARSAEKAYSTGVARLDHTRLTLEQTISQYFSFLQRCELDRLRAAKAVIMGFNAALATLNPKMSKLAADAVVLNESFSPEGDVAALVERYRTGPFRPSPVLFHSHRNQETQVNFGIDLSKWHNAQQVDDSEDFLDVPQILIRLIAQLDKSCSNLSSDEERRKAWIYEVPLKAVHGLREALNNPKNSSITDSQMASLDAPLLAATIKLWLLELNPPPVHYSRYDDVKAIYPQRAGIETPSVDARVDVLANLLSRLPKPHLMVIDVVVSHLRNLLMSTKSSEDDEVYLTKLGLSLARTLLRPKVENAVTLSDRFQPSFLADLIKYYDRILPVAIELRRNLVESEKLPRKNTRPVDQRVRRSGLGIEGSIPDGKAQEILEKQRRTLSHVDVNIIKSAQVVNSASQESEPASPPATERVPGEAPDKRHDSLTEPEPRKPLKADELVPEAVQESSNHNFSSAEMSSGTPSLSRPPPQSSTSPELHPSSGDLESQTYDETHDAPFAPPFQSPDTSQPADLPFVPPTQPNASNEILQSYTNSEIDDEDTPLTSGRAGSSRINSKDNTPSGASLNRKRGVVGTGPRIRSGSKINSIGSPNAQSTSTSSSNHRGIHQKGAPSVGSLRSQFETSAATATTPKRESIHYSPSAESPATANRYRRAGPVGKP